MGGDCTLGSTPMTVMPNSEQRRAVSPPMPPMPMTAGGGVGEVDYLVAGLPLGVYLLSDVGVQAAREG